MRSTYILVAICAAVLPMTAHANCARDVHDLAPRVAAIKDKAKRLKAEDYMRRAQRELDENDEFECTTAVSVVDRIVTPNIVAPTSGK